MSDFQSFRNAVLEGVLPVLIVILVTFLTHIRCRQCSPSHTAPPGIVIIRATGISQINL